MTHHVGKVLGGLAAVFALAACVYLSQHIGKEEVSVAPLSLTDFEDVQVKQGNQIYVDQNEQGIETGTFEAPYQSINAALQRVKPGESIVIRGGTYQEKLNIPQSGNKDAWITLTNYQDETVIVDGETISISGDMEGLLTIQDRSYINIEGLTVRHLTTDNDQVPVGILITGKSHHIRIAHCDVTNISTTNPNVDAANAHGIAVYGTSGRQSINQLIIEDCRVFDNQLGLSEALVLNGNVEEFLIKDNEVFQNNNIGIDFIGFEGTAAKNDHVRNGLCVGNRVWENSTKANPSYMEASAAGIYVDGGQNIVIERNKIYACDIGVEAASEHNGKKTQQITIRNNVIYQCQSIGGIAFGGYDVSRGSAEEIVVTNNTLVDNRVHILVQYHAQDSSNQIMNNIFYQGEAFEGDLTNIRQERNFSGNPLFVNQETADFRLRGQSKALGAAEVNEWVGTIDYQGQPRIINGKIDAGAYQYVSEQSTASQD